MFNKYIKQTQRKLEKKVKSNNKSVFKKPYIFLTSFLRPIYFSREFLMLRGVKTPRSNYTSVIFFTVHKSASTFVKNIIFNLEAKRLKPVRFGGLISPQQQTVLFSDGEKMKKVLSAKGFVYGAFRAFYNFPGLDQYKIILLLRDPRDVLTSQYFSTLYNHPLATKAFFEKRKKYQDYTIDEFVLESAPSFQEKYSDYIKYLLNKPNVLFLKYEDMVTDFEPWLKRLSDFLELKDNDNKLQEIAGKTSFKVNKEDKNNFIRNITPGDHKRKLQPETITKLNNLFENELKELNYTL